MALFVNDVNIDHITINEGTPDVDYIVAVRVNNELVWEKNKVSITAANLSFNSGSHSWIVEPTNPAYMIESTLNSMFLSIYLFVKIMDAKLSYGFYKKANTNIGTAQKLYNGMRSTYALQMSVLPTGISSFAKLAFTAGKITNGVFTAGQFEDAQCQVDYQSNSEMELILDGAAMTMQLP